MSGAARPKVLIVDDVQENLLACERVLAKLDADLVRARSGNEALSRLLRNDFAVVLLDVQMPDMDGFEVASLMRSNESTQHVPIIFVTGTGRDERLVFKGYESGAVDYLLKPVDPDILCSKVDVFLRLHRQQQALSVLAELQRTQTELTRSKADLEAFLRSTFHDLLEPARGMNLMLDRCMLDLEEGTGKDVASLLENARRLSSRLLKLIRDSQRYAEASSAVEWIETDLNDTVRTVLAVLAERTREAGAHIEVGELPTVEGQPSALRLLLSHLLDNAIKFRRPGVPPCIEITGGELSAPEKESLRLDPKRSYCKIDVRDNGIGIEKLRLDDIFRAFVHLQARDAFEGSHLGLAVCRRIVEAHRGSIFAESELGEGTTVSIGLPYRQPSDASQPPKR